mgnify:CR=1 FL=1
MPDEIYLSRKDATEEIMQAVGVGKSVVDRIMKTLEDEGKIHFVTDLTDLRRKLITREEVDRIIALLKGRVAK